MLEGCLTAGLILAPGLACCILELRDMWRGRGHCACALLQLLLCPLTSSLAHLASIWQPRWRNRALLTKTMEGFLCAGPQLVRTLSVQVYCTKNRFLGAAAGALDARHADRPSAAGDG